MFAASASAPCFNNSSAIAVSPPAAAPISAVEPSLFAACASASWLNRSLATARFFCEAAIISGVTPLLSATRASAEYSNSSLAIATWLHLTASIRRVTPLLSAARASAPCSNSSCRMDASDACISKLFSQPFRSVSCTKLPQISVRSFEEKCAPLNATLRCRLLTPRKQDMEHFGGEQRLDEVIEV